MPISGWHACRVRDPGDFQDGSFRTMTRKHDGKEYQVIVAKLKGESAMTEQAYRYAMETWTGAAARAHCSSHDGRFEAGTEPKDLVLTMPTAETEPCGCHGGKPDVEALIRESAHLTRIPPRACVGGRCELRAQADDEAALYLYDSIGPLGISPTGIIERLRALRPGARLRVHLNSAGGDVFDGLAIYNTFRQHDGPISVHIDGLAASIASVIAMAGSRITMSPASFLMIHEPHALVIGTAHDMRHMARLLEKTAGVLTDTYATRATDRAQVRQWMHDETWFTAREALDARLIDAIDELPAPDAPAIAARFDLSGFRHVPPGAHGPRMPVDALPTAKPPARARERARVLAQSFAFLMGDSAPAKE